MAKDKAIATAEKQGADIDWTALYPILTQYQKEMDCIHYEAQFIQMLLEVQEKYGYCAEDAMLTLKDIFAKSYFGMISEKDSPIE